MAFPLGNLSALRTFRVLRALKTVAVVPGKDRNTPATFFVAPFCRATLSRDVVAYTAAPACDKSHIKESSQPPN